MDTDQTAPTFPDFPSLADEIAEPRPDTNIKVAAFTVSKRSINMTVDQYVIECDLILALYLLIASIQVFELINMRESRSSC